MKNLIKVNSVKEFRNNRINIRRKTCPTTFINKNNSKCDLINKEIKSLELLSGIIKSYQIEFLSSKKFENNNNVLIKSLINFKNTLNKSLKEHYEEQNYLYLKVNLFHIYKFNLESKYNENNCRNKCR